MTVTVEKPEAPTPSEKDKDKFEPGYEDGSGKPGEDVTVDAPKFKDKDGNDTKAPEGTTFTPGENAPEGVKVDEKTGEITVPVPEGAKPGDKITVPVDVTYPDGSKDTVDVTVTVEKPEAPSKKPDWEDSKTTPDKPVEIPNTGGPVEDGTTVEIDGPGTAEIDENGKITVTPGKDAKPGDKIKVVVKDKDGKVIDTVEVKITEKPISSSEREGCTESLIGFGLPLLALIPLGIASQTSIPGLKEIQGQVGRQIQDANTALQNQLGIMDPRLAKAAADFDAQLKGAGANLNQVLGGLAVLAYGIAAITTIATKCGPGNTKTQTNVEVSSIFGKGSSSKPDGDKGSSSKGSSKSKDENNGSSSKGSSKGKDENSSSSSKSKEDKGSSEAEGKNAQ